MNNIRLQIDNSPDYQQNFVYITSHPDEIPANIFNEEETRFICQKFDEAADQAIIDNHRQIRVVNFMYENVSSNSRTIEKYRKSGNEFSDMLNRRKFQSAQIISFLQNPEQVLALAEGMILGSYQFLKYKTRDLDNNSNTLHSLTLINEGLTISDLEWLLHKTAEVNLCRNLVNEPHGHLTAVHLAGEISTLFKGSGAQVEVMNKRKIESLKMGGLLGVNKGSLDPPTFTVIEWKPGNAVNQKPYVLVGKGVVFDTGGMNLKPGTSMNEMKSDMAGAAVAASVIHGLALAGIPVHVIGLIPATDNRPGGNAIVPGDVLTMHNGMTVEVLNTDAEGRLILADALSYAAQYEPELVITLATLTGIAARAIGKHGIVAMQAKADEYFNQLKITGEDVYERIVEFPFWDEYADYLKSDVADMKNIGGPDAGMITAGKFLEKFTGYPFIHLDIAGVAFYDKPTAYFPSGGTGYGVRLLMEFFRRLAV